MDEKQCAKKVSMGSPGIRLAGVRNCSRRGVQEHEGKWYCKQHFPPAVKDRNDRAYEQYMIENHEKWLKEHHRHVCAKAIDEAGITRPEGLKEVVEWLRDESHRDRLKDMCRLIFDALGVAPKDDSGGEL